MVMKIGMVPNGLIRVKKDVKANKAKDSASFMRQSSEKKLGVWSNDAQLGSRYVRSLKLEARSLEPKILPPMQSQ